MSIYQFLLCERGAITVDYVMLVSAVVGIGTAVVLVVANGLGVGSKGIDDEIIYTVDQAVVIGNEITGNTSND